MFETTNQLLFFSGCLLYIKWRTPKFLLNLIYSVWDVCRILVTSNQQDMANPRCQRKQVRKCYYNHHPAVHQRTYLSLAVLIEYRHVYIATQYIINMYICISAYIYIYILWVLCGSISMLAKLPICFQLIAAHVSFLLSPCCIHQGSLPPKMAQKRLTSFQVAHGNPLTLNPGFEWFWHDWYVGKSS